MRVLQTNSNEIFKYFIFWTWKCTFTFTWTNFETCTNLGKSTILNIKMLESCTKHRKILNQDVTPRFFHAFNYKRWLCYLSWNVLINYILSTAVKCVQSKFSTGCFFSNLFLCSVFVYFYKLHQHFYFYCFETWHHLWFIAWPNSIYLLFNSFHIC